MMLAMLSEVQIHVLATSVMKEAVVVSSGARRHTYYLLSANYNIKYNLLYFYVNFLNNNSQHL